MNSFKENWDGNVSQTCSLLCLWRIFCGLQKALVIKMSRAQGSHWSETSFTAAVELGSRHGAIVTPTGYCDEGLVAQPKFVYWGEWVKWVGHFLTRLQTFVFTSRTPVWPFPWSMDHGTLFFFFLNNMSFHHLKLKLLNHVQENTAIRHTLQTNCQGRLITISW